LNRSITIRVVQPSHNQCKLDHIAKPPLIVLGVIWPPRHNQQERVAEPANTKFFWGWRKGLYGSIYMAKPTVVQWGWVVQGGEVSK